jgi:enoyl-CoA hydratase/carnithine racemase
MGKRLADRNTGFNGETSMLIETVERQGMKVGVITLNRPNEHNPIDESTVAELTATLNKLVVDPRMRAVILTGSGPSFSSGGDMKKYQEQFRDVERHTRFVRAFGGVCTLLERAPILTVAMVNGTCVAGGTELALACDIVTIADDAQIGDGHLRYGQSPGSGAQRLVRAIGVQRARYWLLSGGLFSAKVAVDIGLATGCAPLSELYEYTMDLTLSICRNSPLLIANIKKLITTALNAHLDDGLRVEEQIAIEYATESHDALEGLLAFAERREPMYRGV